MNRGGVLNKSWREKSKEPEKVYENNQIHWRADHAASISALYRISSTIVGIVASKQLVGKW